QCDLRTGMARGAIKSMREAGLSGADCTTALRSLALTVTKLSDDSRLNVGQDRDALATLSQHGAINLKVDRISKDAAAANAKARVEGAYSGLRGATTDVDMLDDLAGEILARMVGSLDEMALGQTSDEQLAYLKELMKGAMKALSPMNLNGAQLQN